MFKYCEVLLLHRGTLSSTSLNLPAESLDSFRKQLKTFLFRLKPTATTDTYVTILSKPLHS